MKEDTVRVDFNEGSSFAIIISIVALSIASAVAITNSAAERTAQECYKARAAEVAASAASTLDCKR